MEFIKNEMSGDILVVTLSRGKANALNAAMVEELISTISKAESSGDVRAIVLASTNPKFFSPGFDVAEVFQYPPAGMSAFFGRFIDLYEMMFRLPKPLVAAVSGHAYAGGAFLALACEARVMAMGDFGFSLNEINLGMVLPPGMIRMVTHAVGVAHAREMVLGGKSVSPAEALEIGLASQVVEPGSLLDSALALARELASKPPLAFGAVKRLLLEATGHHKTGNDRDYLDQFLEHWFSLEATRLKDALVASMRR